jgi:thioredoxin reductase
MERKDAAYYDYIILGAGPAGLQLAYFMEKAHRNYVVLEAGDTPGQFFRVFPRHRTMISTNKVHTACEHRDTNLRWDWNSLLSESDAMLFKHYTKSYFPSADIYLRYLLDFASHFGLKIKYDTCIVKISKPQRFQLIDAEGSAYQCKRLIVATGRPKEVIPKIPGIELAERYSQISTLPSDYENQRIMIIGKGNSGFETAKSMIETAAVIHLISPKPVQLAWKTHYVGHLRAVNNDALDTYQLKSQNTILDAEIEGIERQRDGKQLLVAIRYTHAEEQRIVIAVDRVILCAGFCFDASSFDDCCAPALTVHDTYPAQTSEWESVNVKDLYFAGTLMHMRDYKKSFSGFIHGFRYNIKALSNIIATKYEGRRWPSTTIGCDALAIGAEVIKRVNTSSAMFQQPGFLCDVVVLSGKNQKARYYCDMPVDYVHDTKLGGDGHLFMITMEYGGEEHDDPFNIKRKPYEGERSAFIHPVLRHFRCGSMVTEYHIPEDLENDWSQDMYIRPFFEFLAVEMTGVLANGQLIS